MSYLAITQAGNDCRVGSSVDKYEVTVKLNENRDAYEALLSNLGIKNTEVPDSYVKQLEKLLVGVIWCIDRFHAYVPSWEILKMRPEFFTNQNGLIVDYLAEWVRQWAPSQRIHSLHGEGLPSSSR